MTIYTVTARYYKDGHYNMVIDLLEKADSAVDAYASICYYLAKFHASDEYIVTDVKETIIGEFYDFELESLE